jgi:RNA polymerase sigma factor (sigma-70 family)
MAELAAQTGLTREQVEHLVAADRAPRALEEPTGEEVGTFGGLLADPLAQGEYERVVGELEVQELRSLLSGLSDREREVLRARYGLAGPAQTLREIGAGHGLSAERVRQIEQRALGKLRAAASDSAGEAGMARDQLHDLEGQLGAPAAPTGSRRAEKER